MNNHLHTGKLSFSPGVFLFFLTENELTFFFVRMSSHPYPPFIFPRSPMPPDISRIESEVAAIHKLMEQQMRSMMGSFGFILDNPFSRFGFDGIFKSTDDGDILVGGKLASLQLVFLCCFFFKFSPEPINEQSPSIPFQGSHNSHDSISPTLPISPPLNPRDEVLKPEFRSKSPAQWSGQDLVLDERCLSLLCN